MLKSTAISNAGLTKQTLDEVNSWHFLRGTYNRALESSKAVNAEIEDSVRQA
jgi:hypothetical protein